MFYIKNIITKSKSKINHLQDMLNSRKNKNHLDKQLDHGDLLYWERYIYIKY